MKRAAEEIRKAEKLHTERVAKYAPMLYHDVEAIRKAFLAAIREGGGNRNDGRIHGEDLFHISLVYSYELSVLVASVVGTAMMAVDSTGKNNSERFLDDVLKSIASAARCKAQRLIKGAHSAGDSEQICDNPQCPACTMVKKT